MALKSKILHLTSVHSPFDGRIFHKECKTLAGAGHEAILVVPHGREEVREGVRIKPVPKPKTRRQRMTTTLWHVYKAAVAEDASVYHFHDSELIPVSLLLRLRGKRVIYDVHEDLPRQILSKQWIPLWLRGGIARIAELTERLSATQFNGVVAATSVIARRFPQSKTVTVQNFPILGEVVPPDSFPYRERDPLIVYAGGITEFQGIRELIGAMALLPASLGAKLILAGQFDPPALETEVKKMPGWDRVLFMGQQQRKDVMRLLNTTRIGVVVDHPIPNYLDGYSTKLFEYMASRIPVVVSAFPLWRELLAGIDCGVFVNPLNPNAIAEAIQWLLTHPEEAAAMGKRGQEAVLARYNWETEARKLLSVYQRVMQ